MRPLTREWVEKAEGDLATAGRELRVRKSANFDAVCFHAQQCAEKYFKSVLQEADIRFGKTHDLVKLLHAIVAILRMWAWLHDVAKDLTDCAVDFRYPGKSADRARAASALKQCQIIRKVVREHLGLAATPQPRRRLTRILPHRRRRGSRGR